MHDRMIVRGLGIKSSGLSLLDPVETGAKLSRVAYINRIPGGKQFSWVASI
jgi:hypothetical protein